MRRPRRTYGSRRRSPSTSRLEAELATQLHLAGVPTPKTEWRFHPKRRWRFDFAWPDDALAVEVEGGTWTGGRHVRGSGFEADCEKYAEATLRGWRVLRVTAGHVKGGLALRWVLRALGLWENNGEVNT